MNTVHPGGEVMTIGREDMAARRGMWLLTTCICIQIVERLSMTSVKYERSEPSAKSHQLMSRQCCKEGGCLFLPATQNQNNHI